MLSDERVVPAPSTSHKICGSGSLVLKKTKGVALGETRRESVSSNGTFDESQLLECLFDSSECGIAILDDQLRYVRINNALAEMNGVAVEFHIGKTVREVLGNAATEIEGQLKRVLSKGVRVDNFHLVAKLPTRKEDAHWNESYLPMKDRNGAVKHVCVIVTELGEGTRDSAYYRKPTPLTRQADEPALSSLTDRELQILQY